MKFQRLTEDPESIKKRVLNSTLTPEVIRAKEESIVAHMALRDAAQGTDKQPHQDEINMLQNQLRGVGDDVT